MIFAELRGGGVMASKPKTYVWKDPARLTSGLVFAMGFNILVHALSLIVGLIFGVSADYSADGADFTGPQLLRWLADVLQMATYLASIVVVFWILRVSRNAHTFRRGLKTSPAWAVGWYLIPFASLVKPYEAMSEIWSASSAPGEKGRAPLLNWWWGAFLLSTMIGGAIWRIDDRNVFVPLRVVADALAVAVSVFLIILARRLSRMQVDKHTIWMTFGDETPAPLNVLERVST